MIDFLKLLVGLVVGLFRSHAAREAEMAFLRPQLIILKRSAPARLRFRKADRLIFVWLYRLFPSLLEAATIRGTGSGNAVQHIAGDDANASDGREHCVGPVVSGSWWKSFGIRSVELRIDKSNTRLGRSGASDSGRLRSSSATRATYEHEPMSGSGYGFAAAHNQLEARSGWQLILLTSPGS
jgi:hypothetical protein